MRETPLSQEGCVAHSRCCARARVALRDTFRHDSSMILVANPHGNETNVKTGSLLHSAMI